MANRFYAIGDDLHHTTTSYLDASDQAAFAGTSKDHDQLFKQKLADITAKLLIPAGIELTDDEKKLCAQAIMKTQQKPSSNGFYKITLPGAMKQLTTATAANNAAQIAILNRIVTICINEHHATYRIALGEANASLAAIPTTATPAAHLAAARDLLAAISAEKVLERMALCFAWYQKFPTTESLDINIPLNEMIECNEGDNLHLNFARINQLGNQEKIAQEIVNFVLALMRPPQLSIDDAHGMLAFVSYELQTLQCSNNPLLPTLDLSSCPHLQRLDVCSNPRLTALDLSSCPQLQSLNAYDNPLLATLDPSNCPQLQTLLASSNRLLTTLDLSSCPQLQDLSANNNARLTTLDLYNCHQLKSLRANNNPLLTDLRVPATTPHLQAAVRESQLAIVAANRARIAAEKTEEDCDLGGVSCAIQ